MPKVIGDITLYTLMELATMLDVTDVTLRRYIKDGKIHATKIGGAYHQDSKRIVIEVAL